MSTLVLFDIDGTLVLTGGAGGRAMARAFSDLYQIESFEGLSMAGRTDTWIFTALAERHRVDPDGAARIQLRAAYLDHLNREIAKPGPRKGVLPGVRPLLEDLSARDDVHLALLTGNLEEGARIKLEHFDLWRYFSGGGFGDDAHDRIHLYADALDSVARHSGMHFAPSQVVVVGDTPLDIGVAVAAGARSLGVATGTYGMESLRAAGADVVVPDLSDLGAVLSALRLPAAGTERSD